MKNSYRILMVCTLLLSMVFTAVGYAQVTDSLTVDGTVSVLPYWEIFISQTPTEETKSDGAFCVVNGYVKTPFLSTVVTLPAKSETDSDPKLTLKVAIQNNSTETVEYIGTSSIEHSNPNIQVKITANTEGQEMKIAPKGSLDLNVTFSYVDVADTESVLNSYFKFLFQPQTIKPDDKIRNDPVDAFGGILNDQTKFDALLQAMKQTQSVGDAAHQIRKDFSFIGTVPNGPESDCNLLNLLFESNNTQMAIDNNRTVPIKGILIATNDSAHSIETASRIYLYVITDSSFGTYLNTDDYKDTTYEAYVAAFDKTSDGWIEADLSNTATNLYYRISKDTTCGMVKGKAPAVAYSGYGGDSTTESYRNSIWSNKFTATGKYGDLSVDYLFS